MRLASLLLAVAVSGGAGTLKAQARPVTDSARLQGTWSMVVGVADGVAMMPDMLKSMKRVAEGPYVTITMADQVYFKAHFVLKPTATPKEIDYHMMEGATKGATQLGIYKFSGDTLWFSFAAPGAARATGFKSGAGDRWTVSAWVKQK